ncbi:hypothetical protein PV11_02508 [Exophiala sideris]|uniref:NAD-dependent epimerase/dehydratase domain-containing protein n=1 Tax=Exophiala sideris TaxID=1016849 RepID=A0A0D1YWK7_9EURO|nr:hypothetical protein PV11_02508 [Exophiala sideris]
MTQKVLLTGGSGFLATHVLKELLQHGHEVVTTVRSDEKGRFLLNMFRGQPLTYTIVKDISAEGAFDEAVKSDPPFDAVIHTASPYHFDVKDNKRDMLDPAVNGTTGILKAITKGSKSVKNVVITSSFAAIMNPTNPPKVYNEETWSDMTWEKALAATQGGIVYRASKAFAEKAAWDFVETHKPTFALTVLNPPLIYGPVIHEITSLANLNTSNKRILNMMHGNTVSPGTPIFVDVRDLALAHVRSIEISEAANQRIFFTAGIGTDKQMGDVIRKNFPDIANNLRDDLSDTIPPYKFDNSKSIKILEINYRSLEETIVDTVKSLQQLGA